MDFLKKGRYLVAGALLSASLLASDIQSKDMYIGAGVMFGSGERTFNIGYETDEFPYNSSAGTIKVGFINARNDRLEFSINSFNIEGNELDDTCTGYDFDYLFTLSKKTFQLYLGLGVGYYQSDKMKGYNIDTNKVENAEAISVNLSAGFIYEFSPLLEAEIAYKYKSMSWNYVYIDVSDSLSNIYIGANIKF